MVIPCDMLFMGNQRVFLYDLLFFFFPDFFPGFSYFQFFSLNSLGNKTVRQPFIRRWWWDWLFQMLWKISFRSLLTGILIPIFLIIYSEWDGPELSQQQGEQISFMSSQLPQSCFIDFVFPHFFLKIFSDFSPRFFPMLRFFILFLFYIILNKNNENIKINKWVNYC